MMNKVKNSHHKFFKDVGKKKRYDPIYINNKNDLLKNKIKKSRNTILFNYFIKNHTEF